MKITNFSEENIILAPPTELFDEAKEIAKTTVDDDKFPFMLHYDANQKEHLLSMLGMVGAIVEDDDDDGHVLSTMMNMTQLAFIKRLDCIERVQTDEGEVRNPFLMEEAAQPAATMAAVVSAVPMEMGTMQTEPIMTPAANDGIAVASASAGARSACGSCSASNSSMATAREINVESSVSGGINCPGANHWFKFTVPQSKEYTIYTTGSLDTEGTLYNASGEVLATNDDYNGKVNFRITATLVQNTVYYIKVTASNMNTGSYTLKVTAKVLPLTISIIPNRQDGVVVLEAGKTYELPRGEGFDFLNVANTSPAPLSVEVTPSNTTNKSVYWSSSSIFTDSVNVTESWYNTTKYPSVTAENVGGAKLFASDIEMVAQRGVAYVAVIPQGGSLVKATGITIDRSSVTVATGNYDELNATVSPANATVKDVEWVSDDPAIATVSPFGRIKGISCGTTTIRAKAMDGSGVECVCQVNVIQAIPIMKITLSPDEISLNKGDKAHLTEKILPTNTTTKTLRWTSSNRGVAEVDSSTGIITAISGGDAYIYAEAQDGSKVRAYSKVHVTQTVVDRAEEAHKNSVEGSTASDPVDVYTGAHMINNTLMTLFGGQGISLVAHYDSAQLVSGMLGHGWYHNYEKRIEVTGTEARVFNNPSIFSRYKADSDCCTRFSCCSANKNGYVLTVDTSRQYPYIIDCNSARTEYYDSQGNLAKIKDHQGFETLISHSNTLITITDCVSGKKMYLEKNADGKVTRVYDESNRQAILTYTNGLLTSIRDVNGNALTYAYDEKNRIVSGTDSQNTRYFENTYDKYGRVCTQKDALNHTTYFEYHDDPCESCDGIVRTVTNRLGKKSYRVYDNKARLIKYIDENDNAKTYEYDEHDNVIKEIDAKGYAVTKVYNRFNKPTQVTDRNGNTTYFTYDACGNVTKIRYPAIDGIVPEETFTYNTHNQMTQHVDIRGTVTVYTYEVNGMPATKKVGAKNAVVYSYESGLLKAQTDARGYTTRYAHNASGQVISKTDADNKVTSYEYDKSGNLLKTIDANGKSIVTTYDGNYQKVTVTDANGNTTSYSYNGNMKNDVITLPDGHTMRYEFDDEDRTVKVIDQLSNATNVTYDDAGRVLSKRLPDGALIQYEYDKVGNVVKETNPKGAITRKTYDKLGNVLTVTDDEGNVTSYEYNAMNKVTRVTNAMAGSTGYTYSSAGDLLSETDALGHTKTYTYDAYGNRLTATDAKNNVTSYTYDQNNNLLTVKDALNHVTTYTYNALNQCVSVKDALNNVIQYGYDALGRRTTITDARGNVFTTTYDGNGNVIKTTDAKGNTISETVYNSLNQPLTVTDAMGKSTTYTYNALGKVESVTDSMNHRTEFSYNSRGQNTEVRDAANNVSSATYDLLGNVTRLAGPLGGATEYTYDDMGRLVSESTVSGGTKHYIYNELNVRKKIVNARGQIRQIFYDSMGRITGYTSPEGAVSYTYDENGNVLTVTDSHGTITRTYDALNRMLSYTDTYGKVICYEYDAVGNLSKIIYPDNTAVTYAYDANHNLVRVTDWANRVTTYTYDENNRVVGVTKPDGSVTTTVYDNKQRVTSTVEKTAGGVVITGFEYTYDDLSRIVEEKHLDKNTKFCYTYDSLSRVTTRTIKNATTNAVISTESFTYDAAGNITGGSADTTFAYDTNNKLISFNGNTVSYDLDGNMLSNGSLTCTYDSANRLVSAGGHTYIYNAEDVRIRKLCADADTIYTYDTNCKLSKLLCKTTNGYTTKYVYGHGLIGEEKCDAFKTYHFDARGSTIAITDANGNITDTFAYDTYGKCISHTGNSFVIFGYNGRDGVVTDKNGLIYMRARYYSPEMKRFINADVIAGAISNAITLNRFAYANGNPVSFVDPFGLSVFDSLKKVCKKTKKIVKTGWEATKEIASAIYHNADEAVKAIQEGEIIDWGINKFKELTQEGKLDNTINFFIGATPDNNGIYHIDQNYWQSIPIVGYNDLYDKAFEIGVGMTGNTVNKNKFEFTTKDGTNYVIWMWKGDYINLGSGAEVGIYKESAIPGHWLTSKENAMPMSLKLQEIDSKKVLFDYHPSENQWWINGFDPSNQNADASNLALTVTIDFSNNPDMYEAFKDAMEAKNEKWIFGDMQATYTWRNK